MRQAVGGKLDLFAGGVIYLPDPTIGHAELIGDFRKCQFLLVTEANHQLLPFGQHVWEIKGHRIWASGLPGHFAMSWATR